MITTTEVTRVFRYAGTEYPDPLPGQSAEQCLAVLTHANPKLNNAAIEGPSIENDKQVYTFKVAVGTKG